MSTTFTAAVDHLNQTTCKATVRTHTVVVDRGLAKGGLDLGPAGGEYLLVALGGCFMSHLLAAIRARDAAVTGVGVVVTGTLGGTPERFIGFTIAVSAEAEDEGLARKLITIAGRACQVVSTLVRVAPIDLTYKGSVVTLGDSTNDTLPAAVAAVTT